MIGLKLLLVATSVAVSTVAAFQANAGHVGRVTSRVSSPVRSASSRNVMAQGDNSETCPRRKLIKDATLASFGLLLTSGLFVPTEPAFASGGATAGGVYLLSAKQRYNARVTQGVKSFLGLGPSLEGGDLEDVKAFFLSEDEGSWKDASASGYLLANAFRRSSATPPDSLPAVKKWKAFAAEVEAMQKSVKKKDTKATLAAYQKAEEALDAYLDEVELPPAIELRR